jgi:tetratricopeptide (TPR) repeat protein
VDMVLAWLVIITASLVMMLPLYAQNQAEKGAESFKNQNYVQSMLYYQAALKCNPISADIMSGAARVYYEQGKILKDDVFLWASKYYFEKAVKLEPLNPFRWRELGIYQARLGNWREAQAAYVQALRLAPKVKQLENEYVSLQKTIEKLHAK